ncbi:hypothetical protein Leryth_011773 [Lithospermum erythrorhizon]|nr:hypothetical protein Leryth_011773 [Lithospermum erythrorhizon]
MPLSFRRMIQSLNRATVVILFHMLQSHLEKGDKVIMPPSALDRLANLQIDYPMLFELSNPSGGKVSHCGVLEFVADEGLIYLPYWMMENMLLQEGDILQVKNTSLSKGTYVKLQPHTQDFLDVSNPKAILEITLRNYSCLTTGDTIMVPYNNKKFYIDIVETKPSPAISIIETDCEVEFAPPLDFKEPEKPVKLAKPGLKNKTRPEEEEEATKRVKFNPFCGSARRLDGKPSTPSAASTSSPLPDQPTKEDASGTNGSTTSNRPSGKLVFGPTRATGLNKNQNEAAKETCKALSSSQDATKPTDEPKFQAFSGKKYSLKD